MNAWSTISSEVYYCMVRYVAVSALGIHLSTKVSLTFMKNDIYIFPLYICKYMMYRKYLVNKIAE